MYIHNSVVGFLLLMCVISTPQEAHTQTSNDRVAARTTVALATHRNLLRQANGLDKLSALIGDVILTENSDERWGSYDFTALTKQSDVIVTAYLSTRESSLGDNGDSIDTNYYLNIHRTMKGEPTAQLLLTVRGGSLTLATGHVATVHSEAWDVLQVGQTVILFLERAGERYRLLGNVQGVMLVNDSRQLSLADKDVRFSQTLRKELEGSTLASAEELIRTKALQ